MYKKTINFVKKYFYFIVVILIVFFAFCIHSFGKFYSVPLLIVSIYIYIFAFNKILKAYGSIVDLYLIFLRFFLGLGILHILLVPNIQFFDQLYLRNNLNLLWFYSPTILLFLHVFISYLKYMYEKVYTPEIKLKRFHSLIVIVCLILTLIGTDFTFGMLYSFIGTVYNLNVTNLEAFYYAFSLHFSIPVSEEFVLYPLMEKKLDSSFIVELTNITFIYTSKLIELVFLAVFADIFLDKFRRVRNDKGVSNLNKVSS
jgi:hypothetical protein